MAKEDALNIIKGRRCKRVFKNTPVPEELIESIIDCGRLAPTGNNAQPWRFIVITDPSIRETLSPLATWGKFIKDAPVCIGVFCSNSTKYFVEDGSAATTCIMLAAEAHGLSTCWVCGHKSEYQKDVEKLLNAPAGYELISLIPLGYSDVKSNINKKSLSQVISYQKF